MKTMIDRQQAVALFDMGVSAFAGGDLASAEELFLRAAKQGMPESWLQVARVRQLRGDAEGERAAMSALRQAADAGDAAAAFAVHLALRQTAHPDASPQEVARSKQYLRRAADAGVVAAQVQLASDYLNGLESGAEDSAAYIGWMSRAAGSGDPEIACALGEFLVRTSRPVPSWLTEQLKSVPEKLQRRAIRILRAPKPKRSSPGSGP